MKMWSVNIVNNVLSCGPNYWPRYLLMTHRIIDVAFVSFRLISPHVFLKM
jgi:hypothetical protein